MISKNYKELKVGDELKLQFPFIKLKVIKSYDSTDPDGWITFEPIKIRRWAVEQRINGCFTSLEYRNPT